MAMLIIEGSIIAHMCATYTTKQHYFKNPADGVFENIDAQDLIADNTDQQSSAALLGS